MQTGKKLCAILLTLCMLVGVLPASVLATGTDTAVLGRQLMLGDDLCMHLHTNVSQELANPVATISVAGVVAETYNIREMTAQENGSYDLSVHLGAPQMTDIINLRIVDGETEVSTPAKYCSDGTAAVLLRLSIQREHNFSVIGVGITGTILILDDSHPSVERFLHQTSLCRPGAVKMAEPYITHAYRKVAGIETRKGHRLLFKVLYLCPGLDHIHILVCTVAYGHIEGIYGVFKSDAGHFSYRLLRL